MSRRCISGGEIIHYPRGNYYLQTETETGELELNLIEYLHYVSQIINRKQANWKSERDREKQKKDIEFFKGLGWTERDIFTFAGLRNLPNGKDI